MAPDSPTTPSPTLPTPLTAPAPTPTPPPDPVSPSAPEPAALEPEVRPGEGGPRPGTPEHVAAGGTYPDVTSPVVLALHERWPTAQAALDAAFQHASTTHGLASDKQLLLDLVDYFSWHLEREGYDVIHPAIGSGQSTR